MDSHTAIIIFSYYPVVAKILCEQNNNLITSTLIEQLITMDAQIKNRIERIGTIIQVKLQKIIPLKKENFYNKFQVPRFLL